MRLQIDTDLLLVLMHRKSAEILDYIEIRMKNNASSDSVRLNTLNSLLTRAKKVEHYPGFC
jgi:hypothetical protein